MVEEQFQLPTTKLERRSRHVEMVLDAWSLHAQEHRTRVTETLVSHTSIIRSIEELYEQSLLRKRFNLSF